MPTSSGHPGLPLIVILAALAGGLPSQSAEETGAWGGIKGRIVWDGKAISQAEEEVIDKDKAHCLERGPIRNEKWLSTRRTKGPAGYLSG